ncbi:signal peptidase I, partial [bacterium]|nr:signal peptidase I [bacterium]
VGERFFADKLTPLFSNIKRGEIIAFNDPLFTYSKNSLVRLFQDYVWGPSNWTKRVIGIPGDTVKGAIEDGMPVIYVNNKKINEPYVNKYPLVRVWKIDPRKAAMLMRKGDMEAVGRSIRSKSFDPEKSYKDQIFYNIKEDRILNDGTGPLIMYPGTPIYKPEDGQVYRSGQSYWTGSDEFEVMLKKDQFWVMGDNRLGSTDARWFGPIDARLIHSRILFRIWSIDTDESWWILDLLKHPIDFWRRVRWRRIFQVVR